jgi:cytochrome d ubiquinol oxidase subunit I
MVGFGTAMMALAAVWALVWWRGRRDGRWTRHRPLLWATVIASPFGFLALEAGWIVTEVGRQPWVIYGVMRTRDAVTPVGGVHYSLAGFTVLYVLLLVTVVVMLRRLASGQHEEATGAEPGLATT